MTTQRKRSCIERIEHITKCTYTTYSQNTLNSERKNQYVLRGHKGRVECTSISCDNQYIASGGADKTIRIWRVGRTDSRKEDFTLKGHEYPVHCLEFAHNLLLSADIEGVIKMWEFDSVNDPICLNTLTLHSALVVCLKFSPDGERFASVSEDSTVKIWNSKTGELIHCHPNSIPENLPCCIAWSSDSRCVACGMEFGMIMVWDAATGQHLSEDWEGHDDHVNCITWGASTSFLASGSNDALVKIWDIHRDQKDSMKLTLRHVLSGHTDPVRFILLSPDNKSIFSAGEDLTLRIWDIDDGIQIRLLNKHDFHIDCIKFLPDCQLLVSGIQAHGATVHLWLVDQEVSIRKSCISNHVGFKFYMWLVCLVELLASVQI